MKKNLLNVAAKKVKKRDKKERKVVGGQERDEWVMHSG